MRRVHCISIVVHFFFLCIHQVADAQQTGFASIATKPASVHDFQEVQRHISRAENLLLIQPDSAFVYADQALNLALSLNDEENAARSYQLIGEVLYHQGVYLPALERLMKAESIFRKIQDDEQLAKNLNQQGLVYFQVKQAELSLEHHSEALTLYQSLRDKRGMAYSLSCIGRIYEKRLNYDEALRYQLQALELSEAINDVQGLGIILENIGSIYEDLENYAQAKKYFFQALTMNERANDSLSMIINLNNLGDIHRKTNQLVKAMEFTRKALTLSERLGDKYQLSSAYKDLSKTYYQQGMYREAYENLENGRLLYEDIYDQESTRQLAMMQTLFEIEQKNNSISKLESQQKLNQLIKVALGSTLFLFALLGGAIISRQRLKIRQNNEAIGQKEEMFMAQTSLIKSELENSQLHEQQLQAELESRSKALTAHALHIMSKNKILEDIQHKLHELLREDMQEQRKRVKAIIKMIENNFVQDQDWNDFRHSFEQVHQNFFDNLQKISGELTPADLRLAALIRLNLLSKDIATILGISTDSLRISRYRLRKKLKLKHGESLTSCILSL